MRLFLNIFRKIVIFLFITGVVFSNLPYNFISEYIDYYRDGANVVDNMWKLQNDDNVVDNFSTLNQIAQNLKVKTAYATTAGQLRYYLHKEPSDKNEIYNSLSFNPPEPAIRTAAAAPASNTFNPAVPALCESSTNTGEAINATSVLNTTAHEGCIASFISPPVGQAITVTVGDAAPTALIYGVDSIATVAGTWKVYLYKWDGTTLTLFNILSSPTDPSTTAASLTPWTASAFTATSFLATDRVVAIATKLFTSAISAATSSLLFDSTGAAAASFGPSYINLKYTAATPNKPVLTDAKSDDFTVGAATTACTTGGVVYNTKWTCLQGTAASSAGEFNNGNAAGTTGDSTEWLWLNNKRTVATVAASNFGATPSNTFLYQTLNVGYGDGTVRTVVNTTMDYTIGATNPVTPFSHSGLVLWTSGTDYIEVQAHSSATKGAINTAFVALNNCTVSCTGDNGTITTVSLNPSVSAGNYNRVWIGFQKTGTGYQAQYSTDGTTWSSVGSAVTHATAFTRVGLNSFSKFSATVISAHSGAFEWFQHTFAPVTTLSNFVSSEPGNSTIAPAASGMVDSFGFAVNSGTDTITAATVGLSAGMGQYIQTVAITNDGDTVTYCSVAPSGDTASLSSCTVPVTTTNTQFKIKLTPISHASMPVPAGGSYGVTATVTGWTGTNTTHAGTDSGSSTLTIDNASPNGATSVSGTAGDAANTINWTTSNSADFDTTSGSVILRWASGSAGAEVPVEGNSSYAAGNTITTATVACVISSAISTAESKIDGTGGSAGCTTSAFTNGQQYTYKAFQRDARGNYDVGVLIGTFTPAVQGPDATSYTNTETTLDFANCGTTGCGGRIGQQITITGTNFGTPANKDVCTSGATNGCVRIANYTVPAANISSWIATQIVFTIPSGVTVYGGSSTTCGGADGNGICVTQNANNDPSGALQFFVFPDITSTTPSAATGAKEGDSITVSGTRFGGAGGTLVFQNCAGGDVDATPTGGNWTDTALTVTVPAGIANDDDSCDIKITRAAGTGSKTDTSNNSANNLGIFVILPNITSVSTNAASARECVATDTDCDDTDTDGLIKLIGNHFGASPGTVQFTGAFGSISATVHATVGGACDVGGWAAGGTSVCVETNSTITDSVNVGNITLTRTGDSKTHNWTSYRIIPRITSITPSADGVNPDSRTLNGNHFCQSGSCLSAALWNAANDDGDDVKFGTTNATVTGTPSDTAVAVTVPSLTPGNYSVTLSSSSYVSNGKNFSYLDNTPINPSNLNQYLSNCSTVITDETTTTSSTVCLKGAVSGGVTGGTLYLQVEVRASATGFTNATAESTGVSAPAGGTESVSVTPGQDTFKWRARTCHNNGGTHNLICTGTGDYPSAAWVEFETGAVPTNDFTIDSNGPVISNISSGTAGEFSVTITWDTNELATTNVNYGTTTTGPYNFIAPNPADTTADTITSHSVSINTNLNCGTTYYYIVKSADVQGTLTTSAEQTFTTGTCNPRVMKSVEFDWVEETDKLSNIATPTIISQVNKSPFTANIQESSDPEFTIRSAVLEMRGVIRGSGGGAPTVNLWINSAATPTPIDLPNTTIPQAFTIRYNIPAPATNLNIAPLSISSNIVRYQFGGGVSEATLINVKLIITYDYTP